MDADGCTCQTTTMTPLGHRRTWEPAGLYPADGGSSLGLTPLSPGEVAVPGEVAIDDEFVTWQFAGLALCAAGLLWRVSE